MYCEGSVCELVDHEKITNDELLELDVDLLIPAALESQITEDNAGRIRARVVAEAANGPVTHLADHMLRSDGKAVIPDMFLNAGGVTVSYFEWTKNLSHIRYGRLEKQLDEQKRTRFVEAVEGLAGRAIPAKTRKELIRGMGEEDLVNSGLEETMITAYQEITELMRRKRSINDMRTAAFVVALEKVGASYLELGIFP